MHPRIVRSEACSEELSDRASHQKAGYLQVPLGTGKGPFEFDSCSDTQGNCQAESQEHNISDLALHFINGPAEEPGEVGLPATVPRLMSSVC